MPDYGTRVADKAIAEIEKRLKSTYRAARRELEAKLKDFERRYRMKSREMLGDVARGKITPQDYANWLSGQVFIREQWQNKIDQATRVLSSSNEQAAKIINQRCLNVFAENYNYQAFRAENLGVGISFSVYNEQAVAQLIADDPQLLPQWDIDKPKDYIWNYKKVNNAVTQGIIQGESVEKIMQRLREDLCTQNENKMRMFARTAVNQAENSGRQKQMEDAAKMGIEINKRWMATLDSRTRDAHRRLDGQEVPYNKPFHSDFGSIRYPCDPAAKPADTYNCRCPMVTIYPKYEDRSKPDWRESETINGQSYQEWKEGKRASNKLASLQQPYTPYKDDLKVIEASIANNSIESAVCIDRVTGSVLFTTTSNLEGEVFFTPQQQRLMNNQTVTHNHPNGSTFSAKDIQTSFDLNVRETRARVGMQFYSLLRMFEPDDIPEKYFHFAADYNTATNNYRTNVTDKLFERTKDADRCNRKLNAFARRWLRRNARKYGWKYTEGIEK